MKLDRQHLRKIVHVRGKIERMTLATCLRLLGVPVRPGRVTIGRAVNQSFLWDLCEQAKRLYIEGVKRIRTDFAENHEAAVGWNALWAQARKLFARRGIVPG